MILKSADDKASSIAQLELLLSTGRVPEPQRKHVEKEARLIKAGIKGETEAAYLIDFYLKDSKRVWKPWSVPEVSIHVVRGACPNFWVRVRGEKRERYGAKNTSLR